MASGATPDQTRPWLAVVEWSDGSIAYIGWRFVDLALPLDAARVPASDTGKPVADGVEARIVVEGVPDEVIVWNHLGLDHLLSVIDNLRLVD